MGLINLTAGQEKSFGIYGTAKSAAATASKVAFDAQGQSYLSVPSEMTDAGAKNKYMTVSIWSNNWAVTSMVQKEDSKTKVKSGSFTIEFKSSEWAKYHEDWVMPPQPTAPGKLSSVPSAQAAFLAVSSLSLGVAYNLF